MEWRIGNMKIRNDYVTNSSSSSFILAFKDEDSIAKTLADNNTGGKFERIYADIMNTGRYNRNRIIEIFRDEVYWEAKWELRKQLETKRKMTYGQALDFTKTEEFEKMLNEEIEKRTKEFIQKLDDKSVVVMIDYGSGGDGFDEDLEFEIVPNLDCCLAIFNHH
jgi:hypothetical protein